MSTRSTEEDGPEAYVVGAGPVGMSTALALDARGVAVEILEAESADRERPGTRADYVHGSTLEILESVHPGLGWGLVDDGLLLPKRGTRWRGRDVYSQTFPVPDDPSALDRLPHSTRIPQTDVEDHMHAALDERDIAIHWDAPVERVDSSEDGVRVEAADGTVREAAYVVGADGGGSQVRKEVGVEMSGSQSVNSFLIIDVEEVPEDPEESALTFHYNHPDVDGRNVLTAPFQGGWRIDVTCRPADDLKEMTSDERVRDIVASTMGERYADRISWVSTYQFKQVTADRFVDEDHRVLLAGDAAHLFAPFGGRGMNSGIHDADAAGSAIASALCAETDAIAEREVENYARLREEAAEWNTHAAGEALEHIYSDDPVVNGRKIAMAELSRVFESAGAWLDRGHFGPLDGPPIPTVGKF